jgi:hypothetical protein
MAISIPGAFLFIFGLIQSTNVYCQSNERNPTQMEKKKLYWRICCIAAIGLCILTFTPLVIPQGQASPALGGVPYSLWTSFIITVLLVVLTYIGTRVHPGMQNEEDL